MSGDLRLRRTLLAVGIIAVLAAPAAAELFINEIYFDPPGSPGDLDFEYVELRGTPSMSLANHYLIFVESEDTLAQNGAAGTIEHIFDLGACNIGNCALGTNGFFTVRQRNDSATNQFTVAAGANDLVNVGPGAGDGFGSGATSLVFSSDLPTNGELGRIENGGWTAMLIRNDGDPVTNTPTLGFDLDAGNNGLDLPTGRDGWVILDAVSEAEPDEVEFGQFYGTVNFGNGPLPPQDRPGFGPSLEPGAVYVDVGYEIEYLARWGNSTGHSPADWHISNLTNNGVAGFVGSGDFRQSGHIHDDPADDFVETSQFVPYGANLTSTLGAANYPLNLTELPWDYNRNGVVDAADYTIWRDTLGSMTDLRADGNNSTVDQGGGTIVGTGIEEDDYAFWKGRFGDAVATPAAAVSATGSSAVPEPASWLLVAMATLFVAGTLRGCDFSECGAAVTTRRVGTAHQRCQ